MPLQRKKKRFVGLSFKSFKYKNDDEGNTLRFKMKDNILSEPEIFYDLKQ